MFGPNRGRMQDTESRADPTPAPADEPTPSAEGQDSPESRATLSDEARVESNMAQGIRNRLAGNSGRPTRGAQARAQDGDPDADDEDDEEEESSQPSGPSTPAAPEPSAQSGEPAPQPSSEPVDRSQLKGRALLRYDLKAATERAEKAERERDEAVASVRTERDQAVSQLGLVQSRYSEVKPKEADAILSDDELHRLEYIETHGGLAWDDQQTLDKARTLREYRQVWIDEADQKVGDGVDRVKAAFRKESVEARDHWGVKSEVIDTATSFRVMFDAFAQAGYARAKAESAERIAQLETDNRALSASAAGREARAPELGGRSAPLESARPGPDASPEEKMAAGIRERLSGGRRNGQRAPAR